MKVTVVGGGPVGALTACFFGKEGHQVELFERYDGPNPPVGRNVRGRSINMALSHRGRAALRKVGLEELVLSKAIPMKGRMLHGTDGSQKPVIYDPITNQCIYSISRQYLNDLLIKEASSMNNVKVNFNSKLIDANLESGFTKFKKTTGSGQDIETKSDMVIGADGAHSTLREFFVNRPMANFTQKYIEHGYIELYIPPDTSGQFQLEPNYLHIWPRNLFMLIALPNLDGSFTVTLFMPFEIFGSLRSEKQILDFFEGQFPDAVPLIGKKSLCNDFLTTIPSTLITISCFPLSAGKSVLIGDAAHAMVPFYGQGMNAGFEDIIILDEIMLDVDNLGVERCLERFADMRSTDVQAICQLALYNYEEMRHLVNRKSFYVRRVIDMVLNKLLGENWTPLYTSVTFSSIPYSQCIANKAWQDKVISTAKDCLLYIVVALLAWILFTAVAYYRR